MRRREVLEILALLAAGSTVPEARGVTPDSADLERLDLELPGSERLARRSVVLRPRGPSPRSPLPTLVLLHGLGETAHELLGIHAWGERYGLVRAHERLLRPPVSRLETRLPYLEVERAALINAALAARAFRPVVLVCPVTPNPSRHASPEAALDRYAAWLADTLLPAVKTHAPEADLDRVGLDGCSLGGFVALEIFLRRPELFRTLGTVQAAFGTHRARSYAERLAMVLRRHPVPLHVETSSRDPYRAANESLVAELSKLGLSAELEVFPGPHDQPWLREVGTLEMLRWHAARLHGVGASPFSWTTGGSAAP